MSLLEAAAAANAHVQQWPTRSTVQIVAHQDPDGVAAAAIAVRWLQTLKRRFHVQFTWRRGPEFWRSVERAPEDPLLVLDMGADELETLADTAPLGLVVDHHPPGPGAPRAGWHMLNPWKAGLDGTRDACASTTMFALALAADERLRSLAPVALAGAAGDRQDTPEWTGWNLTVHDEAVAHGTVGRRAFAHLPDIPLQDLERWPTPELAPMGKDWVARLDLPANAAPSELGADEQQRLSSAMAISLLNAAADGARIKQSVRVRVTSPEHGDRSVGRIAALLEAATRWDEPGLAMAFLLGDESSATELEALEARFHGAVRSELARVAANLGDRGSFRYANVEDVRLVSVAASQAMERVVPRDKPLVLLARGDGNVAVSARATAGLVASGLDLGRALADAAAQVDGRGGGHAIAAGATVPADRRVDFLEHLDQRLAPNKAATKARRAKP